MRGARRKHLQDVLFVAGLDPDHKPTLRAAKRAYKNWRRHRRYFA